MRYIFVILAFTGILLQTFSKGLVLAEFMLNKEYIARVLCINKAKPEKGCNGQCHLMKQMEKETKQEQKGTAVKEKYEVFFSQTLLTAYISPSTPAVKLYTAYQYGKGHNPLHTIFHPPRV